MSTTESSPRHAGSAQLIGGALLLLGVLAATARLGGWPGAAPRMTIDAAGCALGSGLSLIALAGDRRRLAQGFGLLVLALAVTAILRDASDGAIQWAEMIRPFRLREKAMFAAMQPSVASAYVIVGTVLALLASREAPAVVLTMAGAGLMGIATFPVLSFLAANSAFPGADGSLAWGTVVCLLLLASFVIGHAGRARTGRTTFFPPLTGVAVGLLLAVGLMSTETNSALIAAGHHVVRGHQIQAAIERIVARVARMESNVRGYAMSGDEAVRNAVTGHRDELLRLLDSLDALVADDDSQKGRARELRRLAAEKIAFDLSVVEVRRTTNRIDDAIRAALAPDPALRNGLIGVGNVMKSEVGARLVRWQEEMALLERNTRAMQLAGSLLALALVGLTVVQSKRAAGVRQAANAALRESEERFRRAFADAGIGMALVGLDGRFLRVNRAMCDLVGYTEPELLAATEHDLTHPADRTPDMEGRRRDLLAGNGRFYNTEKRYCHRDGRIVWVHATVSLVRDAAGQPAYFVAQMEDFSARKQLEADLRQARDQALEASRLKSEFLATISHEIRTPMNAVIGMAGLLADSDLPPAQKEMSRMIVGGAETLLVIINDILDFSRIEAGRLRLDPTEFNFRSAVEEAVLLLSHRAREKGLMLHCRFDSAPSATLVGDSGRIRQVITNLVGNAIKFSDHGEVTVQVRVLGESAGTTQVRVAVRDTGIGIPPTAQPLLFQPFTQVDGSPTRRHGGTGLGLAICRQLVELMGGRIGFSSEPGIGSEFWFELELPQASRLPASLAGSPGAPVELPPLPTLRRVLLAEDNPANQRVATLMLTRLGIDVTVVPNGQTALAKLAEESFDLLLLDCQMPTLDGFETARRIRSGTLPRVNSKIPIIALTAYARPEDRALSLASGMDDHVPKPVRESELREALQRAQQMMRHPRSGQI